MTDGTIIAQVHDSMNSNDPRITFEEDQWQSPVRSDRSQTPKIIQWVIKYSGGYVKDRRQAEYVLLGFVVVAIVVSLILVLGGTPEAALPVVPAL